MFGKKKEPESDGLIGIDIGAGGIKAVELAASKGRVRLMTYGYSEMSSNSPERSALLDDPKTAAKVIDRIVKESGMKSKKVNASLPSHVIFHSIVTIPQPSDPRADVKPLIEAQVKKLLPVPIEEMIIDSTIIDKDLLPKLGAPKKQEGEKGDKSKKGEKGEKGDKEKQPEPKKSGGFMGTDKKSIRVLVSGAPKDLVAKYIEVFKHSQLDLTSLEAESFALLRSLVGKDKTRTMIVDIGYKRTNISIVQEGLPFLHRSIQAGGMKVTEVMQKQMGVSATEAEQAKLDLSMSLQGGELPPALKEAMMPILHEVKYALELYASQEFHQNTGVEKVIITGGSANLPKIDKFLSDELNMSVYGGDPWARVLSPRGLRPVLDEVGPRFAVAVGLAMKDLEKK